MPVFSRSNDRSSSAVSYSTFYLLTTLAILLLVGPYSTKVDEKEKEGTALSSSKTVTVAMTEAHRYICGDSFMSLADVVFDNAASFVQQRNTTINDGAVIFVHMNYLYNFMSFIRGKGKDYFLITHHSDDTVDERHLHLLNDRHLLTWFGRNPILRHPKLVAIPTGVPDIMTADDQKFLRENATDLIVPYNARSQLLYVNVNPDTNRKREPMLAYFFGPKFAGQSIGVVDPRETKVAFPHYMMELGRSKFVFSPHGYGPDCYRTWEALIMGAVPIVLFQEGFQPLYHGLPIIVVDNYTDITLEFLKAHEKLYSDVNIANVPVLQREYWREKVRNTRRRQ